ERYHGERTLYLKDGRRVLMENYSHGVKNGPFEKIVVTKGSYTRQNGRYENGKLSGRLDTYRGNLAAGDEYLQQFETYLDGKKNGQSASYLPDGRPKWQGSYHNGKQDGWSQAWYTLEVKKGVYYLLTEILHEKGEVVQRRRYNSKGEVLNDEKLR
ncbi:MAG: hypothetical protein GX751_05380, partial [Desulfuromonadaceae bacterium]|nr:hypothetical protein [Desulfuromonadaceae bacterium]